MLSQLFEMENVFTVSSDPHPPPAAPPSLSLPLSSSSTSSGTKKQKRTPTYQRSVSQENHHPSSLCFVLRAWLRRATHFGWSNLQTHFLTSLKHFLHPESWKISTLGPCYSKCVQESKVLIPPWELVRSGESQILPPL